MADNASIDTIAVTETIKIIELPHHMYDEMKNAYHFSDEQIEYLTLFLAKIDQLFEWVEVGREYSNTINRCPGDLSLYISFVNAQFFRYIRLIGRKAASAVHRNMRHK